MALARIFLRVEPASVVGDLDDDIAALLIGAELDPPGLGLALLGPLGRRLEPMIGRVAEHMRERVLDHLKHLPVELGLAAGHVELDLLVELERKLAHEPRQLLPGIGDRLHAGLHDALLQLGGDGGEPLQGRLELALAGAAHELEQLIAGEHKLAHRGHQMLERIDADPHGLRARLRLARIGLDPAGAVVRKLFCRLDRVGPGCRAPGALKLIESSLQRRHILLRTLDGAERRIVAGRHPARLAESQHLQPADQIGVGAERLRAISLEPGQDLLDPVDAGENHADALDRDGRAVAILAHQRFGRVRQLGEAVQTEKAARPFDGVDQPEDGVEHLGIVRLLLEAHELDVELVEALAGFGQEFG